ncbi:4-hydroxyphenylpyruvate dioxygenase-like putative hemolysin [Anoxybacillus calidus]|jgi:hypothetical protein|uniref:4-hydroxyphenylpyruvate dioxygenase-like putative hemolysin n=1 Tax=[Anoxybacillus] calidus TaxID=575178 RepID=A0A7W0BVD7_9BACL|nr:4-hydroxyphenylpyruvate dioxygenase-like putative hemolysin [Anoxybacillus calidus]
MTTIRVQPEELEAVAKHVPDAEDACQRARTSLSWEFPSLVMEIPGIGSAAMKRSYGSAPVLFTILTHHGRHIVHR